MIKGETKLIRYEYNYINILPIKMDMYQQYDAQ